MRYLLIALLLLIACSNVPTEPTPTPPKRDTFEYTVNTTMKADGILPDTAVVFLWSEHLPLHWNIKLCSEAGCAYHNGVILENDDPAWHNPSWEIAYNTLTAAGTFEFWNEQGDTLHFSWQAGKP